ncbi:MAG: NosD domain-containing protein [Candidatus Hodarchaeota archaeon]
MRKKWNKRTDKQLRWHRKRSLFMTLLLGFLALNFGVRSYYGKANHNNVSLTTQPLPELGTINILKNSIGDSIDSIMYVKHDPLLIDGNEDFLRQGALEGWYGDGTSSDPIIIANYNITNDSGTLLAIKNTDLHFQIHSNLLTGHFSHGGFSFGKGISLENVTHGRIVNNLISHINFGIYLEASIANIFLNNTFDMTTYGITMNASDFNSVKMNIFERTFVVMELFKCSNNTLVGNICQNGWNGILLKSFSKNNDLKNNTFFNHTWNGVFLDSTTNKNLVKWNDFLGNSRHRGLAQASDDGSQNTFVFNYWDEYTFPDADFDSIVDNPYPIEGDANNSDQDPRVVPNIPNNLPYISPLPTHFTDFYIVILGFSTLVIFVRQRKKG